MNLDQTVIFLYLVNLSLFIAGIGLITYKGLYFRGLVQREIAVKIACAIVTLFIVLAIVFFSDVSIFVQRATFVSMLVFIGGITINDPIIQKAHNYFRDKKYQEATTLYEKAIQRFSKKTELYLYCGHAYLILGQTDAALDIADRCLKLIPDDDQVLNLKMQVLLKMERYQDLLDMSATMRPKHPEAEYVYLYRAEALQRLYQYELALDELDKMKSPDLNARMERIQLEIKLNRTDKAISDFHAMMQNQNDKCSKEQMAHLLTFSSYVRMKERKYEVAIQEQTNAIDLNTDYCYAFVDRAFCYIITGKFELAQNDLQMAEKISTSDFERALIDTIKALLLWKTGDLPAALSLMEAWNAKRTDNVEILTVLGLMQMQSDMYEAACNSLSRAIELDPHRADAYYYRYKLFEKKQLNDLVQMDKQKVDKWKYHPYFEL
ncbi:MAG: tetratricopeptide repeat protein [Candidatus Melainabacteria bacterium]|nr:tetratricopeptide repeat protein [Candidatus Melainabacteria bacterium]